jgi:hypothetical protein
MNYAQWRNSYTFFVHLGIILILLLGFYLGVSGRVRMVYYYYYYYWWGSTESLGVCSSP